MLKELGFVALGGAIGSSLRYLQAVLLLRYMSLSFPSATLSVNLIGSLLFGFLLAFFAKSTLLLELRPFLFVGLLGGYTTFSSFTWESVSLIQEGRYTTFLFYVLGSVLLGILFCVLGMYVGQKLSSLW